MGGTCSTHGRYEKWVQYFGCKTEDLGVDERIILEWILGK